MTRPVHFDTDAMRQRFLANSELHFAEAAARAKTDDDRLYVATQQAFQPGVTEFLVCLAEAANQNMPPHMVMLSAGSALGRIAASVIDTYGRDPEATATVVRQFTFMLNAALSREEPPEGVLRSDVSFAGTQGGHA